MIFSIFKLTYSNCRPQKNDKLKATRLIQLCRLLFNSVDICNNLTGNLSAIPGTKGFLDGAKEKADAATEKAEEAQDEAAKKAEEAQAEAEDAVEIEETEK